MLKTGNTFGVSDELIIQNKKKAVGEIKKYLRYEEEAENVSKQGYRTAGTAFEVCREEIAGEKECMFCSQNCEQRKKYYIKCIDIQKLKYQMKKMGKNSFKKSQFYVHLCCMERERQLADQLKEILVSAYLVPPKYIFDIGEGEETRKAELKGTAYPYRGKSWSQVLRECRGSMDIGELFLLKERVIFQLLHAVKALHQLPGNLVHRDLKPANMRVEQLGENYFGEILVSIIDWDWVNIGNEVNDPFADICGGTSGFAHPRSFVKNDDQILDASPSKRWDYYSAALTIYYILEEKYHFYRQEHYWESKDAFVLRDMPNTRNYLQSCCGRKEQGEKCYELLKSILQKMMGENQEYQNQYADIQDAIRDFEQYIVWRYGRSHSRDFQIKYLLGQSDQRYCTERLTSISCRYRSEKTAEKEWFYVLAERDAVTLELDGKQIAVLYTTGDKNLQGLILAEGWNWKTDSDIHCTLKYREILCCEETGEQIELYYTDMK